MVEIIDSFCERCGTAQAPSPEPASAPLGGRLLRGLRRGARSDLDVLDAANQRRTERFLRLCLTCRGYNCPACWNDEAGFCQECVPVEGIAEGPAPAEAIAAATIDIAPAAGESVAGEPASTESMTREAAVDAGASADSAADGAPDASGEHVTRSEVEWPSGDLPRARATAPAEPAERTAAAAPGAEAAEQVALEALQRAEDEELADQTVAAEEWIAIDRDADEAVAGEADERAAADDAPVADEHTPQPGGQIETTAPQLEQEGRVVEAPAELLANVDVAAILDLPAVSDLLADVEVEDRSDASVPPRALAVDGEHGAEREPDTPEAALGAEAEPITEVEPLTESVTRAEVVAETERRGELLPAAQPGTKTEGVTEAEAVAAAEADAEADAVAAAETFAEPEPEVVAEPEPEAVAAAEAVVVGEAVAVGEAEPPTELLMAEQVDAQVETPAELLAEAALLAQAGDIPAPEPAEPDLTAAAESEPHAVPELEAGAEPLTVSAEPDASLDASADFVIETQPEAEPLPQAEAGVAADALPSPETEPVADAVPEPEADAVVAGEVAAVGEAERQREQIVETDPLAQADRLPEIGAEAQPEPEIEAPPVSDGHLDAEPAVASEPPSGPQPAPELPVPAVAGPRPSAAQPVPVPPLDALPQVVQPAATLQSRLGLAGQLPTGARLPHRAAMAPTHDQSPLPAGLTGGTGPDAPRTRECHNCQLQLSARAHFCRRCGTRQEEA